MALLGIHLHTQVMGAAGWSEHLEGDLSVLFPVREGRFQVMHKSIADWLQDSERKSVFEINKENIRAAHHNLVTTEYINKPLLPGPPFFFLCLKKKKFFLSFLKFFKFFKFFGGGRSI